MPRQKANTLKIGKKVFRVKTAEEIDVYDWLQFDKGISNLQEGDNFLEQIRETAKLLKLLVPDITTEDFKGIHPKELWDLISKTMAAVKDSTKEDDEVGEVSGKKSQ